ncbi:hypothetical protein IH922_05155 [candidate division KSB1 bacterium]|nr:hypothetical protein [candidate division KSB1 bacterium]
MMSTMIISNGSKWNGQAPGTINDLLKVLASQPLDRSFGVNENFIEHFEGVTRFCGNFLTVSHVFYIDTYELEVIKQTRFANYFLVGTVTRYFLSVRERS